MAYVDSLKASLTTDGLKISVCSSETSPNSDEENYLNMFISTSVELLKSKCEDSEMSADLYTRCPTAILDDIICSYQFEIDEEKDADCY